MQNSKKVNDAQKTGNRRNQFGENVESPTTSGVLLDIVGRDISGMEQSYSGKDGTGPKVWKIRTAKGPDTTRGFCFDYQKQRGRIPSLSIDAVEFVPPSNYD